MFRNLFFYIVTTHNDHPSYVKHVLGNICVFFTRLGYWVRWGMSPRGLVHHLLMQLFTHPRVPSTIYSVLGGGGGGLRAHVID